MNDRERRRLIDAAQSLVGRFTIGPAGVDYSAASCAAALTSRAGAIHTGVCVDVSCGIGFCAEHAAIAEMLKSRETRVRAVVAVAHNASERAHIIPPCGRCRELMMQVDPANAETEVVLGPDRSVPLHELLPRHWKDGASWTALD